MEIQALRNLKDILDRDKELLQDQLAKHTREKNDMINQMDEKIQDIDKLFKEKQDLLNENFKMQEELQRHRFVI